MFDISNNTILFGKTPLIAQNDYVFQEFGEGHGPFGPPGYAYVPLLPASG